jgi:antitoxin (DNA-binding transcriptional repressor) of toxin-antitoxin stability system
MVSISIHELSERSEDVVTELRAGHTLELLQGGKRIAEVVPVAQGAPNKWASEEERLAAVADFRAWLDKGIDLGGFKIENRDELYDRD